MIFADDQVVPIWIQAFCDFIAFFAKMPQPWGFVLFLGLIMGINYAIREMCCWYWKTSHIADRLKETNRLLKELVSKR